ncbi:hypothetical protein L6452_20220 [Arctium lappa]|uniref:Uncharacterized protein n=1 Tax=Arctium lappa TaxID=4217 RepID=A0ACB9BB62_ARCLA|nr:hypothetical protein L6452_20220 [Arctium lappa]
MKLKSTRKEMSQRRNSLLGELRSSDIVLTFLIQHSSESNNTRFTDHSNRNPNLLHAAHPPDEASFDSSVFTLAEDTSLATASSGAEDKDGGEDVSDEGAGGRSDNGGGAGKEPAVGDRERIEGESSEPSCGAGNGEICCGSEETERVKEGLWRQKGWVRYRERERKRERQHLKFKKGTLN